MYLLMHRLGLFDRPSATPAYGDIGPADVDTPEHRAIAREAASQALTLLKNDNHTLPLQLSPALKLAVLGPLANATLGMLSNCLSVCLSRCSFEILAVCSSAWFYASSFV